MQNQIYPNPLLAVMDCFRVSDMLQPAIVSPVCIHEEDSIEDMLVLLSSHGFLSTPVYSIDESYEPRIVGIADMQDIIAFYSHAYERMDPSSGPPRTFRNLNLNQDPSEGIIPKEKNQKKGEDFQCIMKFSGHKLTPICEEDWMETPIKKLMNFSGRNPLVCVSSSMRVSDFVRSLTTGVHHRSLVIRQGINDANPKVSDLIAILSQFDVTKFLSKILHWGVSGVPSSDTHSTDFSAVPDAESVQIRVEMAADAHIRNLGVGTSHFEKPIISVHSGVTVLQAIRFMTSSGISVLAVVDSVGKLLDSLSGSDLRRIRANDFTLFTMTVQDFLDGRTPQCRKTIAQITRSSNLLEVVDTFVQLRERPLHHLWVVDQQKRAVGLISLTDVMRICSTFDLLLDSRADSARQLGYLFVTLLTARNLKPSKKRTGPMRDIYVTVKFPRQPILSTPVVLESLSPSFRNASFSFAVTNAHIGRKLKITLFDKRSFFLLPDKVLGFIPLDVAWIANGFGQGNMLLSVHECKKWIPLQDDGRIDSEVQGELLVKLVFSPTS